MDIIKATELKNRLGEVLERAALGRVAIERHGRLIAYLVPVPAPTQPRRAAPNRSVRRERRWTRRDEERVLALCAGGDFRPSRWLRAGDPRDLAGVATMLASQGGFDRPRMLALAERLQPGMRTAAAFNRWLAGGPIQAARFLPMLRAQMHAHTGPSTPRA